MMKIRPSSIYRYVLLFACCSLAFYAVYSIIAYEDGNHEAIHRRQKHLYLTVSGDRIGHRFDKLAPKRILFWTKIFGSYPQHDFLSDCPGFTDRCVMDTDRGKVSVADALVFHGNEISDYPLPEAHLRKPHQRYVFMSMETPDHSGRFAVPNYFFNWTATYLPESDVAFKYGIYWISAKESESRGFKFIDFKVDPSKIQNKPKSGVFGLISNCATPSRREVAIKELSKYINVTIAGKCANHPSTKDLCPMGNDCADVFAQYPFYIAIENSVCQDYVTEKYWSRLHVPSIPIVMKRSAYKGIDPPPKSFIAMDDYKNPKEMAEHLLMLEQNKTAYAEYFAWRNGAYTAAPWNAPGFRNKYCRLCEKLWDEDAEDSTIEDIWAWFDTNAKCEKDDFVKKWIASV